MKSEYLLADLPMMLERKFMLDVYEKLQQPGEKQHKKTKLYKTQPN